MIRKQLAFVHEFKDRHGKVRRYFRRPGFERVPLPGLPYSPEFMEAYQAAMAGGIAGAPATSAAASQPGSCAAAVASYLQSTAFTALAPETRRTRRNILERLRAKHGDKTFSNMTSGQVQAMIDAKASTPSAARNLLNTLRSLARYCVATKLIAKDPTIGVTRVRIKTEGYATWSEDDIAAFETKHAIGTRARLALALLLHTAQRRSDIVTMGRQHVRNGIINVKQQKTGARLAIPIHPELQRIIDASEISGLTFLTTAAGQPFTPAGFTNWFRDCCKAAELPRGLSAHGLRKAACRRLAEAGCSEKQIAAISGHADLREVARYTKAADQARMAKAAMHSIIEAFPIRTGTSTSKPE
jgi:integrase